MWKFISMSSFVIIGASTIAYIAYRRCNPVPDAVKAHDVMYDQTYYRSCSTNAYTPSTDHHNWTAWQLHTSISAFLTTHHQFSIKQQQRLLFVRWLVRSGRLTEWIIDSEVNV